MNSTKFSRNYNCVMQQQRSIETKLTMVFNMSKLNLKVSNHSANSIVKKK